ncbi:MAG: aspartate 1-decarboxylase [Calditrichaeota bacterium]|nr:aspartate 1-decarboxylase [Calditrichota bacterium]
MQRLMCKSKIHRARVTDANLNYEGSLTLDKDLMEAANLLAFEKVQIVNINNGTRAETYIIEGERGSGEVCINGALARWAHVDDLIIIISYAIVDESEILTFKPVALFVDENNRIKRE